jgi:NADPH2:quinone reductase
MKAIRVHQFGEPPVMQLQDMAVPMVKGDEVLIAAKAVGVNPVDSYIRSGTYAVKPNLPYTPGMDAAGIVEAIGPAVKDLKPGDHVYCAGTLSGAYAEKVLCVASQVHRLPPETTFSQGAALGVPYVTAYRALIQKAKARPGQSVLVHGASGGVGIAAVQMARSLGATVMATAGSDKGRHMVAEQGAHHVLDHNDPAHGQSLKQLTSGHGIDVILEMLAHINLATDLELVAPGGTIVVVGNRGTIEINPRLLMAKDASILGMVVLNAPAAELASIHAALYAGLENKTLRPVISQELPLPDAPKAHRMIMESRHAGKIVLVP